MMDTASDNEHKQPVMRVKIPQGLRDRMAREQNARERRKLERDILVLSERSLFDATMGAGLTQIVPPNETFALNCTTFALLKTEPLSALRTLIAARLSIPVDAQLLCHVKNLYDDDDDDASEAMRP
jgi:hypothetical protein